MSNCCTNTCPPKTALCPANGLSCKQVKRKTVLHHIIKPWQYGLSDQTYYYCDDPECDVIYFGEDNKLIRINQIRRESNPALNNQKICYCFDVTWKDINDNLDICKNFIVEQTKSSTCDCEIRNPPGKCCLKNFKQAH